MNDDDIFIDAKEGAPQDLGNFELMHDGKGDEDDA